MDFTFTNEQDALRDAVREMAQRNATTSVPGDPVHDPALWSAMASTGLLGLPFAEDVGGMGAGPVEVMIAAAELGRAGLRTAYADAVVAGTIIAAGSPQQAGDYLPSISDGSTLVLPALLRAGSHTPDAQGLEVNDDRLTGSREPVPYAAAATHVVTETVEGRYVVASPPLAGGGVAFADTPGVRLTGDRSAGVTQAMALGTLTVCAEALGAMDSALSFTVTYLMTRKQFGRPLAAFQTLTQRAADMYTSVELARSAVYFAAMTLAEDPDDVVTTMRTKVIVGKAARHLGQEAIQLHGGIGMTAEYAVGHLTARLTAIEHTFGGTREHLGVLGSHLAGYESVDVLA